MLKCICKACKLALLWPPSVFLHFLVPEVEFVSPEYTVSEDDGEVDVCLMIDHTISSPVIVRLYASPITAEGMKYYCE